MSKGGGAQEVGEQGRGKMVYNWFITPFPDVRCRYGTHIWNQHSKLYRVALPRH